MSQDNTVQKSQDNTVQKSQDNTVQKSQDNTVKDAIIIIDMNKFPEDIREKLPKDLQDKLMELLKIDQSNKNIQSTKPSGLFAIQHGYVVGNIYKDGILPEEKSIKK